ncbi:dehydrogenase [Thermogymnomonas acidicola]|uniref:Dehydrogenase n=1 Tax=Thermogymnomonas acidicola TaxID=399579 RepID=A0AA37BP76_9ARCH|nr:NADH-quinone oxidoreductase subunit NuoN [Thermogymnomonas acidicola]GGM65901.1 dehydrogenase [Thermogymnomonas acidicola]
MSSPVSFSVVSSLSDGILPHLYALFIIGVFAFLILGLGSAGVGRRVIVALTLVALFVSIPVTVIFNTDPASFLSGTEVFNRFSTYFAIVLIISAIFISIPAMKRVRSKPEVFYATLLFVVIGMLVATFSYNLITLFISFEAVSVGTYILAGYGKDRRNLEASVKYFFTGTIATGFIAFGASFYYIGAHTFDLTSVTVYSYPAMLISLVFLTVGFGFKLAIFPMHQWAIDTYDGTENSVSAFLSAGSKVLAYLITLKVFLLGFAPLSHDVYIFWTILAILTMTYGNLAALGQNNLKRLLAYSSVAQAGYLILVIPLIAYAGLNSSTFGFAMAAAMFYSLVYIFMKGGAFLSVNLVRKENVQVSDLSGLAKKAPATAVSLAIILLALAGIPLTGGFQAKYYLFLSLISGRLWWLAVIAILNSAISVFYYFRVINYMFWREPSSEGLDTSRMSYVPVIFSAFVTVALGVFYSLFPYLITVSHGFLGGV